MKQYYEVYENAKVNHPITGARVNGNKLILTTKSRTKAPKTKREWGYYRVLHETGHKNGIEVKVKELTVDPGKSLSMQRHYHRNEFWFVAEGIATVYSVAYPNEPRREQKNIFVGRYNKHQHTWILVNEWHQLVNEGNEPLKVIEIQFGDNCTEDDIQRVTF